MVLLDGKKTALELREKLKLEVQNRPEGVSAPHLAALLVGNNGASETYVASKVKSCEAAGIRSTLIRMDAGVSESDLLQEIDKLNKDADVDGILVQLPLPRHIDELKVTMAVNPAKDVDGFHPENIGRLTLGMDTFVPATPFGIMLLLEAYGIKTSGMHAVVVGRSAIVGTPMSLLLSRNSEPGNCTVTITHSRTKNLGSLTKQADLVVAALGKPGFLTADMVKEGAIVIDVGITRVEDSNSEKGYRISGDVDFEHVAPICSYITPVPGGVGAMTIAALLTNTVTAWRRRRF
ncbi:MAG: bifunctional 5,10-methylenetetrahydrofolate dehydrogenase/5,10-methenyltetrahydrofolate cyclohydrolase [Bacteroidia bacterium]